MNEELTNEISKLADAGDTDALRQLILNRFADFDEDVQESLMLGAFSEEVEKHAEEDDIEWLQKQGLEALYKIKALRDVLEIKVKAREEAGEIGETS